MPRLRSAFYTLIVFFAIGIAAGLVVHKILVEKFLEVPKKAMQTDPGALLFTSNDLQFRSKDGADLHGWLIHGKSGYPALIFAHDYQSDRSEVLAKLEGLVTSLNKQGYFIFLFDFRGHGKSDSRSGLGFLESKDLEAALQEVLKYKHIQRRIGVLGVGMGGIAAVEACRGIDEVKLVIMDSIYEDIPGRCTETMLNDWPYLSFTSPVLRGIVDLNLRQILGIRTTNLALAQKMRLLYPEAVVFVEKKPLREKVKTLYDATREPKELLQMEETAAGALMGDFRVAYNREVGEKIQQYLPPVSDQPMIELKK